MTMHYNLTGIGQYGKSGPGRSSRKGFGMANAVWQFNNKWRAASWLEQVRWGDGPITCPRCGGEAGKTDAHPKMPYRCKTKGCRKFFSFKTGTPLADSRKSMTDWLLAIYQDLTNLKGVSSVRLSRDLETKQSTTWYMLHRIREAIMTDEAPACFATGTRFQIDEVYIGGIEGNKHAIDKVAGGQGGVTKTIVIGITDMDSGKIWADVITDTRSDTIKEVVERIVPEDATIYTDEAKHYGKVNRKRKTVNHSQGEYARVIKVGDALAARAANPPRKARNGETITTNHAESGWSLLSRSIADVYHKMSPKQLKRYVKAFSGRWNIRRLGTEEQMAYVLTAMIGKELTYDDLKTSNGLPSGSRKGGEYFPSRRRRYNKALARKAMDDEIPF